MPAQLLGGAKDDENGQVSHEIAGSVVFLLKLGERQSMLRRIALLPTGQGIGKKDSGPLTVRLDKGRSQTLKKEPSFKVRDRQRGQV